MSYENGSIKDHGHLPSAQIQEDQYFMDVCRVVAEKGTCGRGKSGCIIVKEHKIIATGYVTAPKWGKTCDEIGHQIWEVKDEKWRITHHCMRNCCAELMAIANASQQGVSLKGATLYTKMTPCYIRHCVHLIVSCGISKVVCERKYQNAEPSEKVLLEAGVELVYLENGIEEYSEEHQHHHFPQKD